MTGYDFTLPFGSSSQRTYKIHGQISGTSDGATPDDAVRNLLWDIASDTPPSGIFCVEEITAVDSAPASCEPSHPPAMPPRALVADEPTEVVVRWLRGHSDTLWAARRACRRGELTAYLEHATQTNPFALTSAIVAWFMARVDVRDLCEDIKN